LPPLLLTLLFVVVSAAAIMLGRPLVTRLVARYRYDSHRGGGGGACRTALCAASAPVFAPEVFEHLIFIL
jgi:hypothetical protein